MEELVRRGLLLNRLLRSETYLLLLVPRWSTRHS
jgi:hypothetical protein